MLPKPVILLQNFLSLDVNLEPVVSWKSQGISSFWNTQARPVWHQKACQFKSSQTAFFSQSPYSEASFESPSTSGNTKICLWSYQPTLLLLAAALLLSAVIMQPLNVNIMCFSSPRNTSCWNKQKKRIQQQFEWYMKLKNYYYFGFNIQRR